MANNITAAGDYAAYNLTVEYTLNGSAVICQGQTITIDTNLTTSQKTGYYAKLKASGVAMGNLKNGINQFTLPDDGVSRTLKFVVYASAVNNEKNTVTLKINELKIE